MVVYIPMGTRQVKIYIEMKCSDGIQSKCLRDVTGRGTLLSCHEAVLSVVMQGGLLSPVLSLGLQPLSHGDNSCRVHYRVLSHAHLYGHPGHSASVTLSSAHTAHTSDLSSPGF